MWYAIKAFIIMIVFSFLLACGIMKIDEAVNKWKYENICEHDKPYRHLCFYGDRKE
jgi:hypothetical protein